MPPALSSCCSASLASTRSTASPKVKNAIRSAPFREQKIASEGTEIMECHADNLARRAKATTSNSEASQMSIALQARSHIGAIMEFVAPSLPKKSALPQAAAFIGFNVRRTRALWNKEARAVLATEISAMEAARARIAERIITKEISKHANTLEVQASKLALADPDLYGPEIARLRGLACRARSLFDCVGA